MYLAKQRTLKMKNGNDPSEVPDPADSVLEEVALRFAEVKLYARIYGVEQLAACKSLGLLLGGKQK